MKIRKSRLDKPKNEIKRKQVIIKLIFCQNIC